MRGERIPPIQALRYGIRRPIGLLIAAFWGFGIAYGLTIPPSDSWKKRWRDGGIFLEE